MLTICGQPTAGRFNQRLLQPSAAKAELFPIANADPLHFKSVHVTDGLTGYLNYGLDHFPRGLKKGSYAISKVKYQFSY